MKMGGNTMKLINNKTIQGLFIIIIVITIYYTISWGIIPACKDDAIVFIIGCGYPQDWDYDEELYSEFSMLYKKFWYNLSSLLSEKWGWDSYVFYKDELDFRSRLTHKRIFVVFDGHGKYWANISTQIFQLTNDISIDVRNFQQIFKCHNLTAVVDSCFSVNWYERFSPIGLKRLYTSDLTNETSHFGSSWSFDYGHLISYNISSFSTIFIDQLLAGLNYDSANITAWKISHS